MANETETFADAEVSAAVVEAPEVVEENDDVKYGFQREEMHSSNIVGTVDPPYERHVFLSYKSHDVWPSHVENSDADPLPKLLSAAFKARRGDFRVKTRLTICESREELDLHDGDVLIFPDMLKYRDLKESEVDAFVEDVLVNGKPWGSGIQEVVSGSFVFVCAHNKRDRRCGVCGPVLIEKFEEEIGAKDLKDQVFVTACSHIGGHKYAGNLIIFSLDSEAQMAGHWYGYVTPDDVLELLDQHIGKKEIIPRIWRGQMGLPFEEISKSDVQKTQNGTADNNVEAKPQEVSGERKENSFSCCQGENGFQCCRDASVEENAEAKKEKAASAKGLFDWTGGKWEQREVLTAVAVVGAVATVAVIYGFYRKSR